MNRCVDEQVCGGTGVSYFQVFGLGFEIANDVLYYIMTRGTC